MYSERIVHIVDDDLDFRQSLARLLEAAGCITTIFASGSAFLTVAPRLSEGCVLLDVQMPRMDGLAVRTALQDADSAAGCGQRCRMRPRSPVCW